MMYRVHRHRLDRALSFLRPVRRYKCYRCGWNGRLVRHHTKASRMKLWRKVFPVMALIVLLVSVVAIIVLTRFSPCGSDSGINISGDGIHCVRDMEP